MLRENLLLGKVLLGLLADRIPHKAALLLDYALLTLSSLLLLALPNALLLPFFVVIFGFSYAGRDVVYPLAIADSFGVRHLAQIYGALMLALLPGGVLGPIFAGAIHDRSGSYGPAFATFALLNLVAVTALCFVRDERGGQRQPSPARAG